MTTLVHRRVEEARQGKNPYVICRMRSGWAVLSDRQLLRGYSLLLPDPVISDMNSLSRKERSAYLQDMTIIGDALLEVTGAARINYEILGNSEPVLHTHIIPRYVDEPEEFRSRPVWFYDWNSAPKFDPERDKKLMQKLAEAIQKRLHDYLETG
ncbi:MAG TPA: hypothetical protein VK206_27915 [Anaerolineales bacterium]|nr:hypothetical protein [Anaerolineales bacterium]